MFIPASAGHGHQRMGPCLSCTRHGAHEAEANIVVPIRRGVVVPIRRTAVRRGIVPASTPFHTVRTRLRPFSVCPKKPFTSFKLH